MKNKLSIKEVLCESLGNTAIITFIVFLITDWGTNFSYIGVVISSVIVFFLLLPLIFFVSYFDKLNFIKANLQEKENKTTPQSVSEDKPVQPRPRRPC